jgi:uncharacterized damage-inducible protein DinB
MKNLLLSYLSYNLWANNTILNRLELISDEDMLQQIAGSFDSISKTLAHIFDAESIWLQRLYGIEKISIPSDIFTNSKEIKIGLLDASLKLKKFGLLCDEEKISTVVSYSYHRTNFGSNTVFEIIQHVCNHSTYHRGQIVNFLRFLGHTDNIPNTDYITYIRTVKLEK